MESSTAVTPPDTPDTPDTEDMANDLAIDVASVDQLFNAPPINPYSTRAVEILGASGLATIVRQLQAHRRDWKHLRLVIRLPPDQVTPGSEARLLEALRRYCRVKIADNALEIHWIRVRSGVAVGVIGAIVAALIALAFFLFTGILSSVPQAGQFVVAAVISLFSWVTLWDVLEALIFNPIPFLRENAALRKIAEMEVVIATEHQRERGSDTDQ